MDGEEEFLLLRRGSVVRRGEEIAEKRVEGLEFGRRQVTLAFPSGRNGVDGFYACGFGRLNWLWGSRHDVFEGDGSALNNLRPKNFELLDWFSLVWIFRSDCFGVFYVSDELTLGLGHPVGVLPDWLGVDLREGLLVRRIVWSRLSTLWVSARHALSC